MRAAVKVDRLVAVGLLSLACLTLLAGSAGIAASPIRQLTNTQASTLRPAWSPDGKRIAFQSNVGGPYLVYVMDADGTNLRRITSGEMDDRHPSWSPDGRFLAMDSGNSARREIWISEIATGTRTQVTRLGAAASFPSWSPDGSRIAFFVYQAGAMDLWTVERDGSAAIPLTRGHATEANQQCTFACHSVAWSPDGKRLALSDGDNARVLLMSSLVASVPIPVSPVGENSHFPIFLGDGRLSYVTEHISLDESWTDLWAVRPDVDAPRTEIARKIKAQGPFALSQDGRELLFASPRSGHFEIYAVTLDEQGKAALTLRPDETLRDLAPLSTATRATDPKDDWQKPAVVLVTLLAIIIGSSAWARRNPRPS